MAKKEITAYKALVEETIVHNAEVIRNADPKVLATALSAFCRNHNLCENCPLYRETSCILQSHPINWIDEIQ